MKADELKQLKPYLLYAQILFSESRRKNEYGRLVSDLDLWSKLIISQAEDGQYVFRFSNLSKIEEAQKEELLYHVFFLFETYLKPHVIRSSGGIPAIRHRLLEFEVDKSSGSVKVTFDDEEIDFQAAMAMLKKTYPDVPEVVSDQIGFSSLLVAVCFRRPIQAIKALLENTRIDPNQTNSQGNTPLHIAVQENQPEMMGVLLEDTRIDPNLTNNKENTPLHIATRSGHPELVSVLLAHNRVDRNKTDSTGNTPLHIAVLHDNPRMIELLLTAGATATLKDGENRTPLYRAVIITPSAIDSIKALLKHGNVDPNEQDEQGNFLLHIAVANNKPEVIQALLKAGASRSSTNKQGLTPLFAALKPSYPHIETINAFLDHAKHDLNQKDPQGNSLLHLAASKDRDDIIRALLASGADPTLTDDKNHTPLQRAILASYFSFDNKPDKAVEALLSDRRTDRNQAGAMGNTLLHLAVQHTRSPAVKALLAAGADPTLLNSKGRTPLHMTGLSIYPYRMVKALLKDGRTNPNHVDQDGNTALHILMGRAHTDQHVKTINILLAAGANPALLNRGGETPIQRLSEYELLRGKLLTTFYQIPYHAAAQPADKLRHLSQFHEMDIPTAATMLNVRFGDDYISPSIQKEAQSISRVRVQYRLGFEQAHLVLHPGLIALSRPDLRSYLARLPYDINTLISSFIIGHDLTRDELKSFIPFITPTVLFACFHQSLCEALRNVHSSDQHRAHELIQQLRPTNTIAEVIQILTPIADAPSSANIQPASSNEQQADTLECVVKKWLKTASASSGYEAIISRAYQALDSYGAQETQAPSSSLGMMFQFFHRSTVPSPDENKYVDFYKKLLSHYQQNNPAACLLILWDLMYQDNPLLEKLKQHVASACGYSTQNVREVKSLLFEDFKKIMPADVYLIGLVKALTEATKTLDESEVYNILKSPEPRSGPAST